MDTLTIATVARASRCQPGKYCLRLRVSVVEREDAWDLCQAAIRYGGVEVRECCFAFANEERRATAADALRFRFGPGYFEEIDVT